MVARMQMPTVGPEQKKFNELFSGTWRGEEKLHPSDWDPKGGTGFGTWVAHPSLDGFFTIVEYTEERDGKINYRGHGVYGWDPHQKAYVHYWFDNMGFPPKAPIVGHLEGNKYWYTTEDGGKKQRMTYEWNGDKLEFRIETSKDGSWSPMHEGRYTRVR
jgi:uncharacterized protein DUF1579